MQLEQMLDFVTGKLRALISAGQFFRITHMLECVLPFCQKLKAARLGTPFHTLLFKESNHSEITMRLFTC